MRGSEWIRSVLHRSEVSFLSGRVDPSGVLICVVGAVDDERSGSHRRLRIPWVINDKARLEWGEVLDDNNDVGQRDLGIVLSHAVEHDLGWPLDFASEKLGCLAQGHLSACDHHHIDGPMWWVLAHVSHDTGRDRVLVPADRRGLAAVNDRREESAHDGELLNLSHSVSLQHFDVA